MKNYKRIKHMRNLNGSFIWERMKRCYDYGYEDGKADTPFTEPYKNRQTFWSDSRSVGKNERCGMTKELEKALRHIKTRADAWAVKEIDKALSQEPCEDAISREAVLKKQYRIDDSATLSARDVVNVEDIEDEPSVTQKSGKWIVYNYPAHECVYCSNCKTEYYEEDLYLGDSEFPKFCPNCGARMVESQERSKE